MMRHSRTSAAAAFAIAASAALTGYNNVFGLHPWHSRWYVRLNASAASAALAAARLSGLSAADLGLGRGRWLPGRLGSGLAAGAAAGWVLIAAVPATRPLLGDNRIAGLDRRAVAYQALIRIPVGTALWEETAFRGVLQAALRRVMPGTPAILVTSGLFGAWHVRPTVQALRANGLAGDRRRAVTGTLAGVAGTAAGGVLLSWLRERTGRLTAPVLLHAAVNSGALIAAHAVTPGRSAPCSRACPHDRAGREHLDICHQLGIRQQPRLTRGHHRQGKHDGPVAPRPSEAASTGWGVVAHWRYTAVHTGENAEGLPWLRARRSASVTPRRQGWRHGRRRRG